MVVMASREDDHAGNRCRGCGPSHDRLSAAGRAENCPSYFMGLFRLIVACVVPGFYDRKRPGPILKERFIRPAKPLDSYIWFVRPASTGLGCTCA